MSTAAGERRRLIPRELWRPPAVKHQVPYVPVWSAPAALRALRAVIVMPTLFALTYKGLGNLQIALFAAFGGFATLLFANFGGTRRERAVAHLGLAVAGSVLLTLGTLVSGTAWIAALVTIPVAFAIFFAGVVGPNAASGINAALLSYILPVASAGGIATVPDRLAGWWMASVAGTLAVLVLSAPSPGDRIRATAADLAAGLAGQLDATLAEEPTEPGRLAAQAARDKLMETFNEAPYRPTGLATADQGLARTVQLLEWCTTLVCETLDGHLDLTETSAADRDLLRIAADLLRSVGDLLLGREAEPDLHTVERARADSAEQLHQLALADVPEAAFHARASHAAHTQAIAVAARAAAADALIAARRADPETVADARRQWFGVTGGVAVGATRTAGLAGAVGVVQRHATVRSVWFASSLRGAVALAAAVAVADLSGVQHGFWVVLGTLSVLRASASATGATAMRALAGTVVGFIIGALLLLGIGTGQTALWVALPIAVLVAAYTPGTAPFALGQAAFTVTVTVLYNLLVPVGWRVGLLRIEDVAIGCAVSLVVGVFFWPRGNGPVVARDLADAFRADGEYLVQSVGWALGSRATAPDAGAAAITSGIRLDDALRAYLTEQGSKRLGKEDLWALVMGALRVRLTANMLSGLRLPSMPNGQPVPDSPPRTALRRLAEDLAGFYDAIAAEVTGSRQARAAALTGPPPMPPEDESQPHLHHPRVLWVREHLVHLRARAGDIQGPAARMADVRRRPWWR